MNSSHYVAGTGNTYRYNFPSAVMFTKSDKIAVANVAIYNSTFNVTAANNNNSVTLVFPKNGGTTTFTATFPDGYYSVSQINDFLTQQIVANNCHMFANDGKTPVPFISIVNISSSFGVQIIIQDVPGTDAQRTSLKISNTLPANTTYTGMTTKGTPSISFNAAFGALLGFPASTLSSSSTAGTSTAVTSYIYTNTLTPALSPINSYVMTCSLLGNSIHTNPPDTIFSIPLSASLGSFIVVNPSQYIFNEIAQNTYNSITIRFYDQNFNPLTLRDTQMVLMLVIKESGEP
jgi:hypothetical protein